MSNPVATDQGNLLQQWGQARAQLVQMKQTLIEEQNLHANTKEKLSNSVNYEVYAKKHIEELEACIPIFEQRLRKEEQIRNDLQLRLQEVQGKVHELEDQVQLRQRHEGDVRAEIENRNQIILGLQEEIASIIRLKNRAIRIRDLVIEILTLSLQIEKENTPKAATISGGLAAAFLISPPYAIAAGALTMLLGAAKGDLNNTQQSAWQDRINQLQAELESVKRTH